MCGWGEGSSRETEPRGYYKELAHVVMEAESPTLRGQAAGAQRSEVREEHCLAQSQGGRERETFCLSLALLGPSRDRVSPFTQGLGWG